MSLQTANFVSVSSSNVESIAYEPNATNESGAPTRGTLYVYFHIKKKGRIVGRKAYEYYDVAESVYQSFLAASSKGTFHHQHIRDAYSYKEL